MIHAMRSPQNWPDLQVGVDSVLPLLHAKRRSDLPTTSPDT
jgi:hypothetical protein